MNEHYMLGATDGSLLEMGNGPKKGSREHTVVLGPLCWGSNRQSCGLWKARKGKGR